MSLVNDMLRDLNRRTPVSNQAARVNGAISSRHVHARKPDLRLGIALNVLLVLMLLGGYWYFQKFGIPGLPVAPSAVQVVPAVAVQAAPAPLVPVVQLPAQATAAVAEPVPAEPGVATTVVSIFEEAYSAKGFTLRIQSSTRVAFDIVARHTYGLTLHLDAVDSYDRSATDIIGMSVQLTGKRLNIEFDLNKAVDFSVYEDGATKSFDILLVATYRPVDVSAVFVEKPVYEPAGVAPINHGSAINTASIPQRPPGAATVAPLSPSGFTDIQPESPALALNQNPQSQVRVNRELTLEQQDRNNSQAAVSMLQGGRVFEAYERLLVFIAQNPTAHQSRETLATLLLAQQDFVQAEAIVDDGLALVPNYSSFKKIKARLLMQKAEMVQAMQLLRNVPPVVTDDPEYHELLASLYQQTNQHAQAVLSYQGLLRVDSKQGRWWTGLAISLEAQGKSQDALASYQAAIQTANLDVGLRQYSQSRVTNLSQ